MCGLGNVLSGLAGLEALIPPSGRFPLSAADLRGGSR